MDSHKYFDYREIAKDCRYYNEGSCLEKGKPCRGFCTHWESDDKKYLVILKDSNGPISYHNIDIRYINFSVRCGYTPVEDWNRDLPLCPKHSRCEFSNCAMKHKYNGDASKVLELRNSSNPLEMILDELQREHVGDRPGMAVVFLSLISSLTKEPVSVVVEGESSGGKTHMVKTILKCFPKEWINEIGRMTEQVLSRRKYHEDLKVLYFAEVTGAGEGAIEQMKLLSSDDGGFKFEYVVAGNTRGEFHTKEKEIPAKMILSTYARSLQQMDNELATRCFSVGIDVSREQTLRVVKQKELDASMLSRDKARYDHVKGFITGLVDEYDDILVPMFGLYEHMDCGHTRTRRDYSKLLSIMRASALLNHRNRPTKMIEDKLVLFCTVEDAKIAWKYSYDYLSVLGEDLLPKELLVLNFMKKNTKYARQDLELKTGIPRSTLERYLKGLVRKNYVVEGFDRGKSYYEKPFEITGVGDKPDWDTIENLQIQFFENYEVEL